MINGNQYACICIECNIVLENDECNAFVCVIVLRWPNVQTNEYTNRQTNERTSNENELSETTNWKIIQRATFSGAIVQNILFHDIITREYCMYAPMLAVLVKQI